MPNNNDNKKTSPNLQDYETEITDKDDFFANIINKLKKHRNQKLLNSGEKIHTTHRSISTMMLFGKFRSKLLTTLENVQHFFISNKKINVQNSLVPEIIGEDIEHLADNIKLQSDQPIIPKNIDSQTVKKSLVPEPIIILAETSPGKELEEDNPDDNIPFLEDEEIPNNDGSSNTLINTTFPTVPTPQIHIENQNKKVDDEHKSKTDYDSER